MWGKKAFLWDVIRDFDISEPLTLHVFNSSWKNPYLIELTIFIKASFQITKDLSDMFSSCSYSCIKLFKDVLFSTIKDGLLCECQSPAIMRTNEKNHKKVTWTAVEVQQTMKISNFLTLFSLRFFKYLTLLNVPNCNIRSSQGQIDGKAWIGTTRMSWTSSWLVCWPLWELLRWWSDLLQTAHVHASSVLHIQTQLRASLRERSCTEPHMVLFTLDWWSGLTSFEWMNNNLFLCIWITVLSFVITCARSGDQSVCVFSTRCC